MLSLQLRDVKASEIIAIYEHRLQTLQVRYLHLPLLLLLLLHSQVCSIFCITLSRVKNILIVFCISDCKFVFM